MVKLQAAKSIKWIWLCLCALSFQQSSAENIFLQSANSDSVVIQFFAFTGNNVLVFNKAISNAGGNNNGFTITTFKFYISGVALYKNDKLVWKETAGYHLIDFEETGSLLVKLRMPANVHYNKLIFNLGIDSATNAAGAGEGDLDAVHGMYWAWQSGYINFKLEGTHPLCQTRKHAFQFHLGGFRGESYCMHRISFPEKIVAILALLPMLIHSSPALI